MVPKEFIKMEEPGAVSEFGNSDEKKLKMENWKLDPLYSCCCSLFIKDILKIPLYYSSSEKEYAFNYRNHPIRWVTLLGVVVRADERSQFFNYAVDDGTGVISCICWKPKEPVELELAVPSSLSHLMQKMDTWDEDKQNCLQVGDLVHIRGKVKVYRDCKQISAFLYRKVQDPSHMTEINHMTDQVDKYTSVYDLPLTMKSDSQRDSHNTAKMQKEVVREVEEKIKEVAKREMLSDIFIHELESMPDIQEVCGQPCVEFLKVASSGDRSSRQSSQTQTILKTALKNLQDSGWLFNDNQQKGLHQITLYNKKLIQKVLETLRNDCQKPKYENGCHYLHVYDRLHQTAEFARIHQEAVRLVLERLEESGKVISVTSRHYIPIT